MAKTFVQPGNVLNFTNATGGELLSGALVALGNLVLVLLCSVAIGETGSAQASGVWALPLKAATPLAAGAEAFLDTATGLIDGTGGEGKVSAGTVVEAAASGDATVKVLLNNNSGGTH